MNNMAAIVFNWKTTLTGVMSILWGAVSMMNGDQSGFGFISTGLGLLIAKDAA